MGWLRRKLSFRKLTTTAALIAALATACADKSEKFVELVAKGDRDVAAELISDSKKEVQWKRALSTLKGLDNNLTIYGDAFPHAMQYFPHNVFEGDVFFGDIVNFSRRNLNNKHYQKKAEDWVQNLKAAGLDDTAAEWEKKIIDYYMNLDLIISERIGYDLPRAVAMIEKNMPTTRENIKRHEVIKWMQRAQQSAKKAGFTKTVGALSDALIEIRGAMAKAK